MAKITLEWTAGTGPISGYKIYRSTTTFDQASLLSQTPIYDTTSLSYVDNTITLTDELYYYAVASYDSAGNQVLSEVIQVAMISAPTNLTAVFSTD